MKGTLMPAIKPPHLNRQEDHWGRIKIKRPQTYLNTYGDIVYDKGGISDCRGKAKEIVIADGKRQGLYLTSHTRICFKWTGNSNANI